MLTEEQQVFLLQSAASLSNMGDHVTCFGDSADLDRLQDAGAHIKTMLHNMQTLADDFIRETAEGEDNATSNL